VIKRNAQNLKVESLIIKDKSYEKITQKSSYRQENAKRGGHERIYGNGG